MKTCPVCNQKNDHQNNRCTACGTKLTNGNLLEKLSATVEKTSSVIIGITMPIVGLTIISFFIKKIYINQLSTILFIPFFIVAIVLVIYGITVTVASFSNDKIIKKTTFLNIELLLSYLGILAFSLFWFGFIIVFDYFLITKKIENWKSFVIYSTFFFIVGLILVYSNLKELNFKRKLYKQNFQLTI